MVKLKPTSLFLICFTIFLVIFNCEADWRNEEKFNVARGYPYNFNPNYGRTEKPVKPGFFRKIGNHVSRGWNKFKSLFRRNRKKQDVSKPVLPTNREELHQIPPYRYGGVGEAYKTWHPSDVRHRSKRWASLFARGIRFAQSMGSRVRRWRG